MLVGLLTRGSKVRLEELQQRQRNSRSLSLSKRRERNLRVSFLTCLRLNVILVTSLDIMLEVAGRTRRNPREGFRHLLQAEEEEDEEPKKKKKTKANKTDEPRIEYYLISSLTGCFSSFSTSWLVDSGASRHITGNRGTLTNYRKKKFTTQVELGDDSTYKIEGVGSTSST